MDVRGVVFSTVTVVALVSVVVTTVRGKTRVARRRQARRSAKQYGAGPFRAGMRVTVNVTGGMQRAAIGRTPVLPTEIVDEELNGRLH